MKKISKMTAGEVGKVLWDLFGGDDRELLEDCGYVEDNLSDHYDRADIAAITPEAWAVAWDSYDRRKGAASMGRKGGKSRSDAKASAARENGRRGGRPKRVYEDVGDWSSVDLTEGQTGWIYWSHTRITGGRTNVRILIPYGTGGYQRGQDMEAMHNDHVTVGDYLCHVAEEAPESGCKILQSGTLVE
jgi:hypothetical protein